MATYTEARRQKTLVEKHAERMAKEQKEKRKKERASKKRGAEAPGARGRTLVQAAGWEGRVERTRGEVWGSCMRLLPLAMGVEPALPWAAWSGAVVARCAPPSPPPTLCSRGGLAGQPPLAAVRQRKGHECCAGAGQPRRAAEEDGHAVGALRQRQVGCAGVGSCLLSCQ
jgi:hypothetical protein